MLEAYKNFWLGYIDFYGRTKRSDYWWVVLISMQIRRLRDANFNVAWIVLKATPLLVVLWVMYAFPTRDSK